MVDKKPTAAQVKKLGERLADLKEQIDSLTKEKAQVIAALALLDPGDYKAGDHLVSIGSTNTIDTALTTKKFPAAKFPDYYKLVFDVTEFRRHVPAVDIAQYEKSSPRVSVK